MELLWKLESLGLSEEASPRWRSVLEVVRLRFAEHADPLHDVLALRGCAAVNDAKGIDTIMSTLDEHGQEEFKKICGAVIQICTGKVNKHYVNPLSVRLARCYFYLCFYVLRTSFR